MKIDQDIEARALRLKDGAAAGRPLTETQLAIRVAWLIGIESLGKDVEFRAFCLRKRERGGLISVEIAQNWRNLSKGAAPAPRAPDRGRPCFDDME